MRTGKNKTCWHVLTGGPSCGKTTLINSLSQMGYKTSPEVARQIIEEEVLKGKTLEQIRGPEGNFQEKVFKKAVEREQCLSPKELVFLDRSLLDCLAYSLFNNSNPIERQKVSRKYEYSKIFFLERVVWEKDHTRTEDEETARQIDEFLKKVYQEEGYELIFIPPVSVEERIKFILGYLQN
ncbi:MAG: ATP-binding protein [bacterium]